MPSHTPQKILHHTNGCGGINHLVRQAIIAERLQEKLRKRKEAKNLMKKSN